MRIDDMLQNTYLKLSTMKRINNASDDPAGLAISQNLTSQVNGYNTATDNAYSADDLAKTANGALSSINDSLQRIRELSVQASNGTLDAGDKKAIQGEIDELKGSISDVAQYTEFNTHKLLDGTFTDKSIASNPSGTGRTMNLQNTSLQSLGIDNFDVTGSFDISDIDNAISMVSDSQSNIGAVSNGLKYNIDINQISSENLQAAQSQISDEDIASMINQLNTQQIMQQYQYFTQQKTAEQKASVINLFK